MKKLFCLGKPILPIPGSYSFELVKNTTELFEKLRTDAAEAVILNYFEDPTVDIREISNRVPFLRIIQIQEISFLDLALRLQESSEKKSIQLRLDCLLEKTNPELIRDLVNIFITKFEFYENHFSISIAEKKLTDLTFHAHNLKSSSANLGALKLATLCQYVETFSREKDIFKLAIYTKAIINEYDKVINYLKVDAHPAL